MRQSGLLPSDQLEIFFGSSALNRRHFLGSAAASAAALHPAFTLLGEQLPRAAPLPSGVSEAVENGGLIALAREALARHRARIVHRDVMAVADFSLASHQPRLHLVDLIGGGTTTLLVAHGRGSDPGNTGWLEHFSNRPGSNASSSGSFLTGDAYSGKHGRSRKLIGLDPENDAAERRAIVIHSAEYVNHEMAHDLGRIGRSQGCFAVSETDLAQVMARLGQGRLLYAGKG
jgi:L,D-transpeptidase catalytic domain